MEKRRCILPILGVSTSVWIFVILNDLGCSLCDPSGVALVRLPRGNRAKLKWAGYTADCLQVPRDHERHLKPRHDMIRAFPYDIPREVHNTHEI